jgi:hypothetical protein
MLVVRDVDIQALSATSLTVLSAAPAVTGRE